MKILGPTRQVLGWVDIVNKKKTKESLDWHVNQLYNIGDFKSSPLLPKDYQFSGSMDTVVDELVLAVKTQPFFASTLTKSDDGYYELNSYDPTGQNGNRFLKLCATLPNGNAGRRVNVRFNKDMTGITSFSVFDDDGVMTTYDNQSVNESLFKDLAGIALYNLCFYEALVHSTFHTLQYIMLQAWVESCRRFKSCRKWAKWYNRGGTYYAIAVGLTLMTRRGFSTNFTY